MTPIAILALVGAGYLAINKKQSTSSPNNPVSINLPVYNPSTGTSSGITDESLVKAAGGIAAQGTALASSGALGAAAAASSAIPIIGVVVGTAIAAVSAIFGAHQAAVTAEAKDLNGAVPAFAQSLQAIFQLANQHSITVVQANSLIDDAVNNYYKSVSSIIKKQGACPIDMNTCTGGIGTLNPCNGPCTVGCDWIEVWACLAKKALANRGTATFSSIPTHAGFNGFQGFSLSYNG